MTADPSGNRFNYQKTYEYLLKQFNLWAGREYKFSYAHAFLDPDIVMDILHSKFEISIEFLNEFVGRKPKIESVEQPTINKINLSITSLNNSNTTVVNIILAAKDGIGCVNLRKKCCQYKISQIDFRNTISQLLHSGKIRKTGNKKGTKYYYNG